MTDANADKSVPNLESSMHIQDEEDSTTNLVPMKSKGLHNELKNIKKDNKRNKTRDANLATSRKLNVYDESGSECSEQEEELEDFTENQALHNTLKPFSRFENFKHMFKSLINVEKRMTLFPIVSILITNDSKRAITVTKESN